MKVFLRALTFGVLIGRDGLVAKVGLTREEFWEWINRELKKP